MSIQNKTIKRYQKHRLPCTVYRKASFCQTKRRKTKREERKGAIIAMLDDRGVAGGAIL